MAVANLMDAILNEDVNEVKCFIEQGVDVNGATRQYLSALGLAIAKNNTQISQLLLNNGAKLPLVKCPSLGYPLLLAVETENVELVKCVLKSCNVIKHGPSQSCPIVHSVRHNNVAMVKALLTAPKCNSGRCRYYDTILHDALFCHNAIESAKVLLESERFPLEFRSLNFLFILLGMTAEQRFQHSKLCYLLLEYGADVDHFQRYRTRNHTPSLSLMLDKPNRTRNKRFQAILQLLLQAGILPRYEELAVVENIEIVEDDTESRQFYDWVYDTCSSTESLQALCRRSIRLSLGKNRLKSITCFPIPVAMRDYISMKHL